MLKQKIEEVMGPITDDELNRALKSATDDVKANRVDFLKRTRLSYVIPVCVTVIRILRKYADKEKAAC